MILRALSALSAAIMTFTVLDAFSFLISGVSLAQNFFGTGSPVSEALLEMIPGMTPLEFVAVNLVAIAVITAVTVASIWYCFFGEGAAR